MVLVNARIPLYRLHSDTLSTFFLQRKPAVEISLSISLIINDFFKVSIVSQQLSLLSFQKTNVRLNCIWIGETRLCNQFVVIYVVIIMWNCVLLCVIYKKINLRYYAIVLELNNFMLLVNHIFIFFTRRQLEFTLDNSNCAHLHRNICKTI